MEYKISNIHKNFKPFAIIYSNFKDDKLNGVYMQGFTNQELCENIPAVLEVYNNRLEIFGLMKIFFKLMDVCKINILDEHKIEHNYTDIESNILLLMNKLRKFYTIILIKNNIPLRVIGTKIDIDVNLNYLMVPSSEEGKWFEAIRQKNLFNINKTQHIPKWTIKTNNYYPSMFKNIVNTLLTGTIGEKNKNISPLSILNIDIIMLIIHALAKDTYDCSYYHLYLHEYSSIHNLQNYEVYNSNNDIIQIS